MGGQAVGLCDDPHARLRSVTVEDNAADASGINRNVYQTRCRRFLARPGATGCGGSQHDRCDDDHACQSSCHFVPQITSLTPIVLLKPVRTPILPLAGRGFNRRGLRLRRVRGLDAVLQTIVASNNWIEFHQQVLC